MNTPWTHAGVPVITLPAGDVDGRPLGLQLAGRHGADESLLALARYIEPLLRGGRGRAGS
jgi:Asp-tRNA(Asn)/Glu-tRNA(Gln) amidotransferase A subunit family amidase